MGVFCIYETRILNFVRTEILINTRLQPGGHARQAGASGFNRFARARKNRSSG